MINRDRRCVFVADTLGHAEVVALWLCSHDLPARVMDTATLGGLEGLTWMSKSGTSSRGIEVWVENPQMIQQAMLLLQEHSAELANKTSGQASATDIDVVCEDCNWTGSFPGSERGTVQNCARCGAYLDIPGEEDEWDVSEGEMHEEGLDE